MAFLDESAVILMYHRVSSVDRDPFWLNVRPERFREQLAMLKKTADVVPLRELTPGARRVAITFDDGYADNQEVAKPLLDDAALPATFFVSSCVVEQGPGFRFWWDRVEHLLLDHASDLDISPIRVAPGLRADLRSTAGRFRALAAASRRLRVLGPFRIEQELANLATRLGAQETACRCHRVMSESQLRDLDASPIADIGGHTRSHAQLASLDAPAQRAEVALGRAVLEETLDHPIESFAYPFGGHEAFDRRSVGAARRAGFVRACTTIPRSVTRFATRYRLPRFAVRDWSGADFSLQLERWFSGLGTGPLHS
ncbi:MAG: polysaccharide deacetylase family protein [Acidimicrobiia bacterium]